MECTRHEIHCRGCFNKLQHWSNFQLYLFLHEIGYAVTIKFVSLLLVGIFLMIFEQGKCAELLGTSRAWELAGTQVVLEVRIQFVCSANILTTVLTNKQKSPANQITQCIVEINLTQCKSFLSPCAFSAATGMESGTCKGGHICGPPFLQQQPAHSFVDCIFPFRPTWLTTNATLPTSPTTLPPSPATLTPSTTTLSSSCATSTMPVQTYWLQSVISKGLKAGVYIIRYFHIFIFKKNCHF